MDLELTGKKAIVTGGSRGIGKAIARELALEGVDVVIASRGADALTVTAAELAQETGRRIVPIAADTTDDVSVRSLVEQAVAAMGGVDILVNCAAKAGGQTPPPKAEAITPGEFWEEMNTKVLGYLRCAQAVAPHMRAAGWGRIINVSGLAARQTGSTLGSIRNVAVAAMTKNLADELGPYGIGVTCVHPGLTRTEATERVVAARAASAGVSVAEIEAQMAKGNSIQRFIEARDIAAVVTFLASPRSLAIHGDSIAAGGGVGRAIHY
jgi:NAD(P)-dependent dehydrogenase (short-subunit alcohol dehydrogenase family)